jgi:acyl-CoA thioester hydrolase
MARSPEVTPFRTQLRVRYADTDAAGVVYYANYLTYFEVARVDLLRSLGTPINAVQERGVVLPVVEARCKYRRPARLDDLLDVFVFPAGLGKARFGFTYEVRRGDEVLATGMTRHAVVDRSSGRPLALPGWLRALFELVPPAEHRA